MTQPATPVSEDAPAKINLALHVTGKREDAYHLLESLVVFAAVGDKVSVVPAAEDSFRIDGLFGAGLPADGTNLVVRARDALRAGLAECPSPAVGIHLEKNLPLASGIGGGSSDAAAALKALNRLWNTGLEEPQLARMGERLGADVPMCLAARPLIARGAGEQIEVLERFPQLHLLLVNPGVGVSTPSVFRALSSPTNDPLPPLPDHLDVDGLVIWLKRTRNDLQAPAVGLAPEIAAALDEIEAERPVVARMSGSGATCFGVFVRQEDAYRAAMAIRGRRPAWFVVATRTLP